MNITTQLSSANIETTLICPCCFININTTNWTVIPPQTMDIPWPLLVEYLCGRLVALLFLDSRDAFADTLVLREKNADKLWCI